MLDQNTDRMWYVIGAVIVGAAIIFLVNSSFPQLFASVGTTFEDKVTDVSKTIKKMPTGDPAFISKDFEVEGDSQQSHDPTPDNPATITNTTIIKAGSEVIELARPLRSVDGVSDKLYLDKDDLWKFEWNIADVVLDGSFNVSIRRELDGGPKHTIFELPSALNNGRPMDTSKIMADRFKIDAYANGKLTNPKGTEYIRSSNNVYPNHIIIGIENDRLSAISKEGIKQWLNDNPIKVLYIQNSVVETASPSLQNQLNALLAPTKK